MHLFSYASVDASSTPSSSSVGSASLQVLAKCPKPLHLLHLTFFSVCPLFCTPSDPDHSRSACCPLLLRWQKFVFKFHLRPISPVRHWRNYVCICSSEPVNGVVFMHKIFDLQATKSMSGGTIHKSSMLSNSCSSHTDSFTTTKRSSQCISDLYISNKFWNYTSSTSITSSPRILSKNQIVVFWLELQLTTLDKLECNKSYVMVPTSQEKLTTLPLQ